MSQAHLCSRDHHQQVLFPVKRLNADAITAAAKKSIHKTRFIWGTKKSKSLPRQSPPQSENEISIRVNRFETLAAAHLPGDGKAQLQLARH